MDDVSEIIRLGYKSLAQRTLEAFDEFNADVEKDSGKKISGKPREIMRAYRSIVRDIRSSGRVFVDTGYRKTVLLDMNALIPMCLPEQFKPKNPEQAFQIAAESVRAYKGYESIDEMIEANNIVGYEVRNDGTFAEMVEIDGKRTNHIRFSFHELTRVLSVVEATHEIWHCLQPETDEPFAIHKGAKKIDRYDQFLTFAREDDHLWEIFIRTAYKNDMFDFFSVAEVRERAAKFGLEMGKVDAYISEVRPKLNAIRAYIEGDAYYQQGEILGKSPQLQQRGGIVGAAFRLYALNNSLLPSNPGEKQAIYHAGIGMVEFARKNNADDMIRSPEFALKLHETYFAKTK